MVTWKSHECPTSSDKLMATITTGQIKRAAMDVDNARRVRIICNDVVPSAYEQGVDAIWSKAIIEQVNVGSAQLSGGSKPPALGLCYSLEVRP